LILKHFIFDKAWVEGVSRSHQLFSSMAMGAENAVDMITHDITTQGTGGE
jgi:hypothetical protein